MDGQLHKNYVCCEKCFKLGQKLKTDVESKLAITPVYKLFYIMDKTRVTSIIKDFWNGIIYKIPLCCNIYFCKMQFKRLRPAIVSSLMRGEDRWDYKTLTDHEKSYVGEKVLDD